MYNRNPVTWLEEIGRSNKSKASKGIKDGKEKVKKEKSKKVEGKSS